MAVLFTDLYEHIHYIEEAAADGTKSHFIHGIFLQANIKNRNGRYYPVDTLENEVNRYVTETINQGRAYGELGHPQGPQINLDRVSHLITELKRDGNNFIGKAKLTETPMGNIAKGLLKSGANLGVSSRGMGSLKSNKEGIMEVQNDFRLATAADIVADPSAPNAFVKGILEGVEYFYNAANDCWKAEQVEDLKEQLRETPKKRLDEDAVLAAFKKYLNIISR